MRHSSPYYDRARIEAVGQWLVRVHRQRLAGYNLKTSLAGVLQMSQRTANAAHCSVILRQIPLFLAGALLLWSDTSTPMSGMSVVAQMSHIMSARLVFGDRQLNGFSEMRPSDVFKAPGILHPAAEASLLDCH